MSDEWQQVVEDVARKKYRYDSFWCFYCGSTLDVDVDDETEHSDRCVWVRARRLVQPLQGPSNDQSPSS